MYGAIPEGLCAVVPCGSAIAFVVCDKSSADFGEVVLTPIVDDKVDPPTFIDAAFIDAAVIIPETLILVCVMVMPIPTLNPLVAVTIPATLKPALVLSSNSPPVILVNGILGQF